MSKVEEAYSIEYGEIIDAEKSYELFWEGSIVDKRAFECTDPNCSAQITCVNIDKMRSEMKQMPHFKCYGEHSKNCEVIREFNKEHIDKQNKEKYKSNRYIDNSTDVFYYKRPEGHKIIQKVEKEKHEINRETNRSSIKKQQSINGKRIMSYYSIKPLISKFEKYSYSNRTKEHFIVIKDKNEKKFKVSYENMFINIKDINIKDIKKYYRIYYGIGEVYRAKKDKNSFVIKLLYGFNLNNKDTLIYVSNKIIEKSFMKSKWRRELEDIVKERQKKIMFYINSIPQEKEHVINLPLNSMDFFDYRVISEEC